MKRDPALASLSRDHHLALFAAQKLQRATAETAAEARSGLLDYLAEHGREHFREEEEILLPAFAEHGDPHDPLVARALCEHVDVRHRAGRIERDPESPIAELQELGELLAAHVRFEERELFPLIEEALPPDELAALAAALDPPGSA